MTNEPVTRYPTALAAGLTPRRLAHDSPWLISGYLGVVRSDGVDDAVQVVGRAGVHGSGEHPSGDGGGVGQIGGRVERRQLVHGNG